MAQARTLALSGGLYPWLSIVDNVQLQAVLFGRKSAKTTEKAKMLLEKVGMAAHLAQALFAAFGRAKTAGCLGTHLNARGGFDFA